MRIGTPFGAIESGGIECGSGVKMGTAAGYIGWTYAEPGATSREITSADGEYVANENYILRYTGPKTSEVLGYTYEGGGGPYTHIADDLAGERDLQFKTLDDEYADTPKDLAIFEITGSFESGRSPLLMETFDSLDNDTTVSSGIGNGYSLAYDKQNEILWVGSSGNSSSMTLFTVDVSDETNPTITQYLQDELVENPTNGYASVKEMEYNDGAVYAIVTDFSTPDPTDRITRLTYGDPVQVSTTEGIHTYEKSVPSENPGGEVSISSGRAYYTPLEANTIYAVETEGMELEAATSKNVTAHDIVAKGGSVYLLYETRDLRKRGIRVLETGDLSTSFKTLLGEDGGEIFSISTGPESFDQDTILASGYGESTEYNLYNLEVGAGEKRIPYAPS